MRFLTLPACQNAFPICVHLCPSVSICVYPWLNLTFNSPCQSYASRQSSTFNCTVVRPLNSLSEGEKARSNFPTGSDPFPAFHQTASCVTDPSVTHILTCCLLAPMRCNGF